MLNLIKYEYIKKSKLIAIVIICIVLANLLIGIKYGAQGCFLYLGLLSSVLFLLFSIDVIIMYSKDINNISGYMIFMTPNSGYTILGSKIITAISEGLLMLVFYNILVFANFVILGIPGVESLSQFFNKALFMGFNFGHILVVLFLLLVYAIQFILTIYTSITLRKSILANIKFKGLFSFLIFIAINYIIIAFYGQIGNILPDISYNITFGSEIISAGDLFIKTLPAIALITFVSIVLMWISGYLLEKKINL